MEERLRDAVALFFTPFFLLLQQKSRTFAHCYGTELYLDSFFSHRVCYRTGEAYFFWRFRRLSGHDGLDVLIVEDGL